jgi:hypothetical protein
MIILGQAAVYFRGQSMVYYTDQIMLIFEARLSCVIDKTRFFSGHPVLCY